MSSVAIKSKMSWAGGNNQAPAFTKKTTGFQAIKYFFTYHIKENESDEQVFLGLANLAGICAKYIWAKEMGKSGKTPHIQGAFILKNNRS